MRSLIAAHFGRATLVLPSCDGPVTWIVQAIAVVTQGPLTLPLGRFSSDNSPDWKMGRIRDCRVRLSHTNPP